MCLSCRWAKTDCSSAQNPDGRYALDRLDSLYSDNQRAFKSCILSMVGLLFRTDCHVV